MNDWKTELMLRAMCAERARTNRCWRVTLSDDAYVTERAMLEMPRQVALMAVWRARDRVLADARRMEELIYLIDKAPDEQSAIEAWEKWEKQNDPFRAY